MFNLNTNKTRNQHERGQFILEGNRDENGELWLHILSCQQNVEEHTDSGSSVRFQSKEELVQFCVSILGYNAK